MLFTSAAIEKKGEPGGLFLPAGRNKGQGRGRGESRKKMGYMILIRPMYTTTSLPEKRSY